MIKIAMLGCDSSHTEAYAELLNNKKSDFYGRASIDWLWGEDMAQAKEKAAQVNIKNIASTPEEAVEHADIVFVSGRYGDSHFYPASVAVKAKKPTYVDKPFTNQLNEAIQLSRLARAMKTPLCSFTPFVFSNEFQTLFKKSSTIEGLHSIHISGPADSVYLNNERSKQLPFYGVHVTDLCVALCGSGIKNVFAQKNEKGISAVAEHKNGIHFTLNFPYGIKELYHCSLYGAEEVLHFNIDAWGNFYHNTLDYLLNHLPKGQLEAVPLENACESIALLNAIELSLKLNKPVSIDYEKV